MKQLIVAATPDQIAQLEGELTDYTAGRWSRYVQFVPLSDSNKTANDAALHDVPATHPGVECFADKNVTSRDLEDSGVARMSKAELRSRINAWLDENRISWRGNVAECKRNCSYKWMDVDEWRYQFNKVDPDLGPSVAIAILAQLRIVGMQELVEFLTGGLEETSHNAYFMGADPHSGDHGVAMMLSQAINNQQLSEAFKLPQLTPDSSIRMFNDGGWSGGESSQRLKCLYKNCDRKECHIESSQSLEMHFAFITDIAETALQSSIQQIEVDFKVSKGSISISCPPQNRLRVLDSDGASLGLAFRDSEISRYVDPVAMQALCKRIGKKLTWKRPLGTHEIASTIGFWHSLPKAMLPVLIMGGGPIRDGKGGEFSWRPLISSQHVLRPAQDDPNYHCSDCPLAPKEKKALVAKSESG
jgi:hypothetical protein